MSRGKKIWWTIDGVREAKIKTDSIYEWLLQEISIDLNNYHAFNWETIKYRKLIGAWLRDFIDIAYERMQVFEKFGLHAPNYEFIPPVNSSSVDIFSYSSIQNDRLATQISSAIDGVNSFILPEHIQSTELFRHSRLDPKKINACDYYHLYKLSKPSKYLINKRSNFLLRNFVKQINFQNLGTQNVSIDKSWRLSAMKNSKSSYYEIIYSLVRLNLPIFYLEHLKELVRCVNISPEDFKIYTANSIHRNDKFKLIATISEADLLIHQHGAGYGMEHNHTPENFERSIAKIYYTWGWVDGFQTKALSVPHRLMPTSKNNRPSRILLKCGDCSEYPIRFMHHHIGVHKYKLYSDTSSYIRKVSNLPLDLSYKSADGESMIDYFHNHGIYYTYQRFNDSWYSLHVLNNFSTSFLESLSRGIPTLCLLDRKIYFFREDAELLIKELELCRVIVNTPEDLAAQTHEVALDPKGWWLRAEIQEPVNKFLGKFSRFSNHWVNDWKKEFSMILDDN